MAEKTCFIIAPIGETGSATRKRADQVQRYIVEPVVLPLGYGKPQRSDQVDQPGMITNQIVEHLLNDDLVIADLTELNPNVLYELAVRHAVRKPVVHLVATGDIPRLPFDVKQVRAIQLDHQDLDSVEKAKKSIRAQIEHVEAHREDIENPISHASDILAMKRSDDSVQQSFGELRSDVDALRSEVRAVFSRLGSVLPTHSHGGTLRNVGTWLASDVFMPASGPPNAFLNEPASDFSPEPEDLADSDPEEDREPDFDDIGD